LCMKKAAFRAANQDDTGHAQLAWHDRSRQAAEVIGVPKNKATEAALQRAVFVGLVCG